MTRQKRITIPKPLYERICELAKKRGQSEEEVLEAAINLAEKAFRPTTEPTDSTMQDELA